VCARSLLIPLSHVRQAGGSYARSGRSALPSGWSSAKTPDGKGVYYYNDATGETLHRTHFSHMSHPTFPISHLLFPFFLVSPTHPFLPYVAPHFSHISPFILVFLLDSSSAEKSSQQRLSGKKSAPKKHFFCPFLNIAPPLLPYVHHLIESVLAQAIISSVPS